MKQVAGTGPELFRAFLCPQFMRRMIKVAQISPLGIYLTYGRTYCAITALEWSHSIYGKPFTRYPCRFKHVRAAGGVMFKRVMSEAQIIEWAKAQAK